MNGAERVKIKVIFTFLWGASKSERFWLTHFAKFTKKKAPVFLFNRLACYSLWLYLKKDSGNPVDVVKIFKTDFVEQHKATASVFYLQKCIFTEVTDRERKLFSWLFCFSFEQEPKALNLCGVMCFKCALSFKTICEQ